MKMVGSIYMETVVSGTNFMTSQVVQPTEIYGMLGMAQPMMHAAIVAGASKIL